MQLNSPLRGLLQQRVSEKSNAIGGNQEVGPGLENRNTALDRWRLAEAIVAKTRCLTVGPIRLCEESRGPNRSRGLRVSGPFKDNLRLQIGQKSRRESLGLRIGAYPHQSDLHPTQRVTRRRGNTRSQIGQHAGVETAGSHRSLHPQDQFLLEADRQLSRMPDLAIGQFFCLTEGHEAACRCVSLSLELTPIGSQRRPSSPEGDRTHHQQDYQQNCRPPVHGSQKKGAPGFSGRPTSEETKNKTSAAVNNPR